MLTVGFDFQYQVFDHHSSKTPRFLNYKGTRRTDKQTDRQTDGSIYIYIQCEAKQTCANREFTSAEFIRCQGVRDGQRHLAADFTRGKLHQQQHVVTVDILVCKPTDSTYKYAIEVSSLEVAPV